MRGQTWSDAFRTLIAGVAFMVFLVSTLALVGNRTTAFGRATESLRFWHEGHRSLGYDAEVFCDPTRNPPREALSEEFAECYRTSVFAPGQEPNLIRVVAGWRWYEQGGWWAPTRWHTRLTVLGTECVPGKATEDQFVKAGAFAIERMCEPDAVLTRIALDAVCSIPVRDSMTWWCVDITIPRPEGSIHNAISAASLGAFLWAVWPRRNTLTSPSPMPPPARCDPSP